MAMAPKIRTYHCAFCTNLVLATTHRISRLPTRKGVQMERGSEMERGVEMGMGMGDGSFILPVCGVVPVFEEGDRKGNKEGGEMDRMDMSSDEEGGEEGSGEQRGNAGGVGEGKRRESEGIIGRDMPDYGFTSLLSLSQGGAGGAGAGGKDVVIRREDGFEKRRLYRCGRCGVVVGYEVLGEDGKGRGRIFDRGIGDGDRDEDGERAFEGKILYLLKGGLMSTEVMAGGKRVMEQDAEVVGARGGGEGMGVWE